MLLKKRFLAAASPWWNPVNIQIEQNEYKKNLRQQRWLFIRGFDKSFEKDSIWFNYLNQYISSLYTFSDGVRINRNKILWSWIFYLEKFSMKIMESHSRNHKLYNETKTSWYLYTILVPFETWLINSIFQALLRSLTNKSRTCTGYNGLK